jgi:hypothetical protein
MRDDDNREVQVTCYCFGPARKSHLTLGEIKNVPPPFIMVCPCGSGAWVTYDRLELLSILNKRPEDGPFKMTFREIRSG